MVPGTCRTGLATGVPKSCLIIELVVLFHHGIVVDDGLIISSSMTLVAFAFACGGTALDESLNHDYCDTSKGRLRGTRRIHVTPRAGLCIPTACSGSLPDRCYTGMCTVRIWHEGEYYKYTINDWRDRSSVLPLHNHPLWCGSSRLACNLLLISMECHLCIAVQSTMFF